MQTADRGEGAKAPKYAGRTKFKIWIVFLSLLKCSQFSGRNKGTGVRKTIFEVSLNAVLEREECFEAKFRGAVDLAIRGLSLP